MILETQYLQKKLSSSQMDGKTEYFLQDIYIYTSALKWYKTIGGHPNQLLGTLFYLIDTYIHTLMYLPSKDSAESLGQTPLLLP